jgi:glutamate--cysteine ligase
MANELLASMTNTAKLLDAAHGVSDYSASIASAQTLVSEPQNTPSGRILDTLSEHQMPFWQLGLNQSRKWHQELLQNPLHREHYEAFVQASDVSLQLQRQIEQEDTIGFEDYLAQFYAQYQTIDV